MIVTGRIRSTGEGVKVIEGFYAGPVRFQKVEFFDTKTVDEVIASDVEIRKIQFPPGPWDWPKLPGDA